MHSPSSRVSQAGFEYKPYLIEVDLRRGTRARARAELLVFGVYALLLTLVVFLAQSSSAVVA